MEKEENYSASMPPYFTGLDHSLDQQHAQDFIKPRADEASEDLNDNNGVVQYMPNNPQSLGYVSSTSLDRLSFADVMQFADFGPKLGLNQTKLPEEETGIDPVYFLKFPVLNDKSEEDVEGSASRARAIRVGNEKTKTVRTEDEEGDGENNNTLLETCGGSENSSVQLRFIGENNNAGNIPATESKNKRKRPRAIKTSEEVESQRMTHIAVERNRRKQMNEHLRVLRSLMPGSYVQRGDQASIIGGAIEFVRELEQLLQCLESQKRRRLFGDNPPRQVGDSSSPPPSLPLQQPDRPPFFPPNLPLPPPEQMKFADYEAGLCEETAENKSCLADVEVKLLGFDAMIKILSRRRPGQLIKTIAALEDLQLNILHTNITTIEQTVLYSFNVKIAGEARFTADEIASSVQQIFSFIHANSII